MVKSELVDQTFAQLVVTLAPYIEPKIKQKRENPMPKVRELLQKLHDDTLKEISG